MNEDPKEKVEETKEKLEELPEEEWPRDFEHVAVCCQTGCPDCPWGFNEQFDPDVPIELQIKSEGEEEIDEEDDD